MSRFNQYFDITITLKAYSFFGAQYLIQKFDKKYTVSKFSIQIYTNVGGKSYWLTILTLYSMFHLLSLCCWTFFIEKCTCVEHLIIRPFLNDLNESVPREQLKKKIIVLFKWMYKKIQILRALTWKMTCIFFSATKFE